MIAITIENSTFCGADCLFCARKKMENVNQNMPDELFYSIIDDINEWNDGSVKAISFVGTGDPLLDPGFSNKVRYVKHNTDLKIHLTNTCHMLSGEILEVVCEYVDSVKISHYGACAETFSKVHGKGIPYDRTVENINALLKREKRPRVYMGYLMVAENESDKDIWIDMWESKCEEVNVWTPHNWAGLYQSSSTKGEAKTCGRPGKDFHIHVDGKVSACCLDVCGDLLVGDLQEQKWKDIIGGDKLAEVIRLHEEGKFAECGICGNCDLIYDRTDALIYSSNKLMKVGMKAGFGVNSVNFSSDK